MIFKIKHLFVAFCCIFICQLAMCAKLENARVKKSLANIEQGHEYFQAIISGKLPAGNSSYVKRDIYGNSIENGGLFYYNLLNDKQQRIYRDVVNAVAVGGKSIKISEPLSLSEADDICIAVRLDYPEFFWYGDKFDYHYKGKNVFEMIFKYCFDTKKIKKQCDEFFKNVEPIVHYASLLDNDMDKIKYVNDYLVQTIDYDFVAFKSKKTGGVLQSAYSAVVNYKAVCAGYSAAFQFVMQQLGIPCTILSNAEHAWNLVFIGGQAYNIDVTNNGVNIPIYFNVTTESLKKSKIHKIEKNSLAAKMLIKYPCNSTEYSYRNYFGWQLTGNPYTYQEFSDFTDSLRQTIYTDRIEKLSEIGSLDDFQSLFAQVLSKPSESNKYMVKCICANKKLTDEITKWLVSQDAYNRITTICPDIKKYNSFTNSSACDDKFYFDVTITKKSK